MCQSLLLLILIIFTPGLLKSEELKKENFSKIEANQQNLEKQLDTCFESLDRRFELMDKRFDDIEFLLQLILWTVVLIICLIIAQWISVWRKLDRLETLLDERMVIGYKEEMQELRKRIEKLEIALAK